MCFRVRERPGCAELAGEEEEEDGRGGQRPHLCCRPAPSAPGPLAPSPVPEPQVTPGHPASAQGMARAPQAALAP